MCISYFLVIIFSKEIDNKGWYDILKKRKIILLEQLKQSKITGSVGVFFITSISISNI